MPFETAVEMAKSSAPLNEFTCDVGRKVNSTVCSAAEFSMRAGTEYTFLTRVLEQPKL